MPGWNFVLDLRDVWHANDMPFPARRDEIVRRIREALFYDPGDIVLRSLVDDVADAGSVPDFNRHFDYLFLWGDQPDNRVCFDTSEPNRTNSKESA